MTHAHAAPGGASSGAACRADGSTVPHGPTAGVDETLTVMLPGDDGGSSVPSSRTGAFGR